MNSSASRSSTSNLSAIVLAAGQGTRMKSTLPKPAHPVCGRPMVNWVLRALKQSNATHIVVVVGHGSEQVTAAIGSEELGVPVSFVEQRSQRGTGDAASVGLTGLADDETDRADVIILPGDTPLLEADTIATFVDYHRSQDSVCTIMTAILDDPTGYGRIVRNRHGSVERIVEHKDASPEELEINEVNAGIYCLRQSLLAPALRRITPNNAQGEYYLTDVAEVLRSSGYPIHAHAVAQPDQTNGVNDRAQLMDAELRLRDRLSQEWMKTGVSILDPAGTVIDAQVSLGADIIIQPGCSLTGSTVVGDGSVIGPGAHLSSCAIGAGVTVLDSHVGADAVIGAGSRVGPYAVVEPGAEVDGQSVVAPFSTVTS